MYGGSIRTEPSGVARFFQGGDVMFPDLDLLITARILREHPMPALATLNPLEPSGNQNTTTAVLHRPVLRSLGRPLWYFRDYAELLKAFRAVINSHRELVKKGVLYRDISASNIMLSASESPPIGEEGFLMDLESAKIEEIGNVNAMAIDTSDLDPLDGRTRIKWSPSERGAQMTGTVQFMAREVIQSILRGDTIEHQPYHDLESFAWVFAYVVARRLVNDVASFSVDTRKAIKENFGQSFGHLKLDDVHAERASLKAFSRLFLLQPGTIPDALVSFMGGLLRQLQVNCPGETHGMNFQGLASSVVPDQGVQRMTHDNFLALIDHFLPQLSLP